MHICFTFCYLCVMEHSSPIEEDEANQGMYVIRVSGFLVARYHLRHSAVRSGYYRVVKYLTVKPHSTIVYLIRRLSMRQGLHAVWIRPGNTNRDKHRFSAQAEENAN